MSQDLNSNIGLDTVLIDFDEFYPEQAWNALAKAEHMSKEVSQGTSGEAAAAFAQLPSLVKPSQPNTRWCVIKPGILIYMAGRLCTGLVIQTSQTGTGIFYQACTALMRQVVTEPRKS